jgi:hypothetical protein
VAGLTQELFVRVVVGAAFPQWLDVVYRRADAHAVMAQALLAQPVVALADALTILDTSPAALTLNCVRSNRGKHSKATASSLQARL